jgi:HSP20 family molecular chaperone IbpA
VRKNVSRIIIENIPPSDGESVSLVEQVEALLEEIRRKAQKLMGNGEASAFDRWLRNERDRFWAQQVELIEHEQSFHIRMAVPSPGPMQINVIVSPAGIEVRKSSALSDGNGEDPGSVEAAGELIRQIPLSGPVDADSVTATLGRGELRLAGAMARKGPAKRSPGGSGQNPQPRNQDSENQKRHNFHKGWRVLR